VYTRNWTIPGNAITAQGFQALEKEYFVTYDVKDNTYTIKKEISGPIYITNYDPDTLLPEERARLIEEAKNWHANDVSFDLRPNTFIPSSRSWVAHLGKTLNTMSKRIRARPLSWKIQPTQWSWSCRPQLQGRRISLSDLIGSTML
jgi:hypothetical protein